MKFNKYIIFAAIFFIVILIVVIFNKKSSPSTSTVVNKKPNDISEISDSMALINTFNIFKEKKSFYSDDKNCFWTPEITNVKEFIPNNLVQIEFGPYLSKRISEKCPYKVGDAYPSEGFFLLAKKINNQWQFITELEKMCLYVKQVPEAKEFLVNTLQGYYGVCK